MKKQLKLTLDAVKAKFGKQNFTVTALHAVLKQNEKDLPLSTLRWRIHSLKTSGEIEVRARGTYALSSHRKFELLKLSPSLLKIAREIESEFPHARYCVWSSELLNQFTIHQPSLSFTIIEVEKDVLENVFSFLQGTHKNILLNPGQKEVDHYLLTKTKSIIAKPLLHRAPLMKDTDRYSMPSFEKILVDLLAEPDVFFLYQGSELRNIWREICHKYPINYSTLNNYAKRRNINGIVDKMLNELHLLTYNQATSHDPS